MSSHRSANALSIETHFERPQIYNEPDGTFSNGIPNPMLLEIQAATAEAVVENKTDMRIAWDGDFDRCLLMKSRMAEVLSILES